MLTNETQNILWLMKCYSVRCKKENDQCNSKQTIEMLWQDIAAMNVSESMALKLKDLLIAVGYLVFAAFVATMELVQQWIAYLGIGLLLFH